MGKGKPLIVTKRLRKVFDDLVAVRSLDLKIHKGEIFGLLGPNGAGKTTTINMLCGLARPTSGSAIISGHDVQKDQSGVRKLIGIVPQKNVLDRDLTIRQNLRYHGKLHQMPKEKRERRIEEVLELVMMKDRIDDEPLELSGGMKRRVTIAKALMHEPGILFLDEPTTGLDPQSRRAVWEKILLLKDEGITMILTTHYMDEAELLCDRIAIIDRGRIIALGTPDDLRSRIEEENFIEIELMNEFEMGPLLEEGIVTNIQRLGKKVRLMTRRKKEAVARLINEHGDAIKSIDFHEPTLEDVFLNLTGKELRER
jgi:ABC-2 type transport system ATP-binding protein